MGASTQLIVLTTDSSLRLGFVCMSFLFMDPEKQLDKHRFWGVGWGAPTRELMGTSAQLNSTQNGIFSSAWFRVHEFPLYGPREATRWTLVKIIIRDIRFFDVLERLRRYWKPSVTRLTKCFHETNWEFGCRLKGSGSRICTIVDIEVTSIDQRPFLITLWNKFTSRNVVNLQMINSSVGANLVGMYY